MALLWALGAAACLIDEPPSADAGPEQDADAAPVLTAASDEEPGENCPFGGTRIDAGLDGDGNGVLAADEVEATTFVCDDGPEPPRETLTTASDEAPGTNCVSGGTRLDAGPDLDGNGVLSADEVESTTYLCSTAESDVLVVTTTESSGDACPLGGTRIDAGVDLDADGALSAVEVTSTIFVCAAAASGTTIVVTSSEPPGDNCERGGTRVDAGIDDDADGSLATSEIDATSFICTVVSPCSNVIDGDVAINDALGASALDAVCEVTGDITVNGCEYSLLPLSSLRRVGGDLRIFNCSGGVRREDLRGLENLSSVGGFVDVTVSTTDGLALRDVGGLSVSFASNIDALSTLRTVGRNGVNLQGLSVTSIEPLTGLESMGGFHCVFSPVTDLEPIAHLAPEFLSLRACPTGPALPDFENLTQATNATLALFIMETQLTSLAGLEALSDAGPILITGNSQLQSLSLPALRTVATGFGTSVRISGNAALTDIELRSLVSTGPLQLADNPLLSTVTLGADGGGEALRAPSIAISNSPLLGSLSMTSWVPTPLEEDEHTSLRIASTGLGGLDGLPALSSLGELTILSNPSLVDITALFSLETVNRFTIRNNASLPHCQVTTALEGLAVAPTTVTTSGNDDSAICP
jgi:hypothetical protein